MKILLSALDSKRMMILGYRAVHDKSETKDDKKYAKNNSHEARNRRAKNVMKLLGEHDGLSASKGLRFQPKFPEPNAERISLETDYEYNRS